LNQTLTVSPDKGKLSFAGDVLKLVSGTTIAQVLSIVSAPLLARLYSPEAFGISTLFFSIVGIISVVSCLRYEMAIMLPNTDEEAVNILALSLSISVLVGLISVPVVLIGGPYFLSLINATELTPYIWLVPLTLFWGGLSVGHPALNYWNSRTRHYGRLSIIQIVNVLGTLGFQVAAGFLGYNQGSSLILGMIFGSIVSTTILGYLIWKDDRHIITKSLNVRSMLAGLKRYNKFPRYDLFAVILNTASWQLPSYLLSAFFSATSVGYYSMGNRVLRLPMNFIGSSIAQVFFQRAAEAKQSGSLAVLVENVYRILVKIGMFPMLLLSIIGSDLFVVVFGKEWMEAGIYTQILAVWMFFWFISSPLSTLFRVLELQEFSLGINIAIFVTRLIALLIGGWLGNARLALALFAISGVVMYGYLSLSTLLAAGVSKKKVAKILLQYISIFIPAALLLLLLKSTFSSPLLIVVVSVVLVLVYGVYVIRSEEWLYPFLHSGFAKFLTGSKG